MGNTTANEVIQSFESSFADKTVLPLSLEMEWFKKAIGRYSAELSDLHFDVELNQFDSELDRYVIDTLAEFMKQSYQERQYSKVNKRISITGKDIGLDYFDLISPLPLDLVGIGRIKSPKLIEIADISYYVYAQYVSCLRMTPSDYIEDFKIEDPDINLYTKFDLILYDSNFRNMIKNALNFFFVEDFEWFDEYKSFLYTEEIVRENGDTELLAKGIINSKNYYDVLDIILQRVHITPDNTVVTDITKIKNKRGLKIYKRLQKVKREFKKSSGGNPDLSLPNIISSVAVRSLSLNWINIWDITIYQLFNEFERLQIIDQYDIASTQVSVWGDKEKKFKFGAWSSNIYNKNDAE